MRVAIRRIGNFQEIILPAVLLANVGLEDEAEVSVENGAIVLRPPVRCIRNGWGKASMAIAAAMDDGLVTPELVNAGDDAITW